MRRRRRRPDETEGVRGGGREQRGGRAGGGRSDDGVAGGDPGIGFPLVSVVAVASMVALAAHSVTAGIDGAVAALDPTTVRMLGLSQPLEGAVAASALAGRLGSAAAGVGGAYGLARAGAWLYLRTGEGPRVR